MDIRQIDDNYSVSGQIEPDDVRDIAAEGFRTIICNRPDGEEAPSSPNSAKLHASQKKPDLQPIIFRSSAVS